MDILIEEEEKEKGNDCFGECFDDDILDSRQKIKREVSLDQNEEEKIYSGASSW